MLCSREIIVWRYSPRDPLDTDARYGSIEYLTDWYLSRQERFSITYYMAEPLRNIPTTSIVNTNVYEIRKLLISNDLYCWL